jgi:hypothetical protein
MFTFFSLIGAALFGYYVGRRSLGTDMLEGSALVVSAGDFVRNAGHEAFAQNLYKLSNAMRKAAA